MTAQVFHGVPIPKRSGGPPTEGLYSKLQDLEVDSMLFVEHGTSRSTSATVARVGRNLGRRFTSRKVACERVRHEGTHTETIEHRIVKSGTLGAIEGIGIWRVA